MVRRLHNWSYRDVKDFLKEIGFSFFEPLKGSHQTWIKLGDDGEPDRIVEINFRHDTSPPFCPIIEQVDAGMKTSQQLSRQAIDEFKAIYLEEFGQSLTDDEVHEIALRLLRFFGILSRPHPADTQKVK